MVVRCWWVGPLQWLIDSWLGRRVLCFFLFFSLSFFGKSCRLTGSIVVNYLWEKQDKLAFVVLVVGVTNVCWG